MDRETARHTLEALQQGDLDIEAVLEAFSGLAVEDLESARIDHQRALRCGFPEVVYGAGKTDAEVLAAAEGIREAHGLVLVTRASASALATLHDEWSDGEVHERCGCFLLGAPEPDAGPVAVVSAGTTDAPVAEEAALVLRARGVAVTRCTDCWATSRPSGTAWLAWRSPAWTLRCPRSSRGWSTNR